jgi:type I restriction enzyme S subunit
MYEIKYRDKDEMKDSGVEWIGEIPEDWEIEKIKYNSKNISGYAFKSDDFKERGIPIIRIGDIKDNIDFNKTKKIEKKPEYNQSRINKGDIIIALTGATIGKTSYYKYDKISYLNQRNGIFRSKTIDQKLLYYWIKSDMVTKYIKLICYGSAQDNISNNDISKFKITKPIDNEQQKISNFLDYKTSQFDSIIEKKEKLIEKLEEAKKSLISEVVTGKVKIVDGKLVKRDESEMKDSGVEWLGKIPEDWDTLRLKLLFKKVKNGIWGDEEKNNSNDVFCIRVTNFNRTKNDVDIEDLTIRNLDKIKQKEYLLDKNDLLIEKSGGGENQLVGFVVIYNKDIPAIYANFMARIVVKKQYDNKYLLYYFRHLYDLKVNYKHIKQTTGIQNIDTNSYLDEKIGIFDINEQQKISNFLDYKTSKFDSIIEKKAKLIEKLKKAKQSLISEAVTGKIDLRDWEIKEIKN